MEPDSGIPEGSEYVAMVRLQIHGLDGPLDGIEFGKDLVGWLDEADADYGLIVEHGFIAEGEEESS